MAFNWDEVDTTQHPRRESYNDYISDDIQRFLMYRVCDDLRNEVEFRNQFSSIQDILTNWKEVMNNHVKPYMTVEELTFAVNMVNAHARSNKIKHPEIPLSNKADHIRDSFLFQLELFCKDMTQKDFLQVFPIDKYNETEFSTWESHGLPVSANPRRDKFANNTLVSKDDETASVISIIRSGSKEMHINTVVDLFEAGFRYVLIPDYMINCFQLHREILGDESRRSRRRLKRDGTLNLDPPLPPMHPGVEVFYNNTLGAIAAADTKEELEKLASHCKQFMNYYHILELKSAVLDTPLEERPEKKEEDKE